jgi:hypothetical protein
LQGSDRDLDPGQIAGPRQNAGLQFLKSIRKTGDLIKRIQKRRWQRKAADCVNPFFLRGKAVNFLHPALVQILSEPL